MPVIILLLFVLPPSAFANPQFEEYKELMQGYWSAGKWEDRLPFILNPNENMLLMERYYRESTIRPSEVIRILLLNETQEVGVGEYAKLRVTSTGKFKDWTREFYALHTEDGFKIDWQASVGYNPMTWKAFAAQQPKDPVKF